MTRDAELRDGIMEWRRLILPAVGALAAAAITFAISWGGVIHDQQAQASDIKDMREQVRQHDARLSQQEGLGRVILSRLDTIDGAQRDMNKKLDTMAAKR